MPEFNLCIVEGKCHYKVWAFLYSFPPSLLFLTVAEACLGLNGLSDKSLFSCFFFFICPGTLQWGSPLIIISMDCGGKESDKSFPFSLPHVNPVNVLATPDFALLTLCKHTTDSPICIARCRSQQTSAAWFCIVCYEPKVAARSLGPHAECGWWRWWWRRGVGWKRSSSLITTTVVPLRKTLASRLFQQSSADKTVMM